MHLIWHKCRRHQPTLEHASIVAELVYGFLIPEVAKQEFRERGRSSLIGLTLIIIYI